MPANLYDGTWEPIQNYSNAFFGHLKILLCTKHLYQMVKFEWRFPPVDFELSKRLVEIVAEGIKIGTSVGHVLPNIETYCSKCERLQPHIPKPSCCCQNRAPGPSDHYVLVYECPKCLQIVRFFVVFEDNKLKLRGRDPIESLAVPEEVPKAVAKYFSDAVVAYNCGHLLPSIFMLRVVIEQFWLSIPAVRSEMERDSTKRGGELGKIYQATHSPDFNKRAQSLTSIYDKLSGGIHSAQVNPEDFESAREGILDHFADLKLETRRRGKFTT